MSLFDQPEQRNLADVFPPGTPFRLVEAFIAGQAKTSTGSVRTLGKVVVSAVESPEVEGEYGVWGSLCEQIRKIEPGELPLIVTLDNTTGLWVFVPHGSTPVQEGEPEPEQEVVAVPEAHLDLDAGESDNPTPVPPPATPVGTHIDDSHTEAPPELPNEAPPRGTGLDESQVFQPGPPEGQE
jgi:hypothetical protein